MNINRVFCGLFLILAGCSLEYDITEDAERSGKPEMELHNLQHAVIRSGRTQLRVHAKLSQTFQSDRRQELYDVYFWEYDIDGEVAAEGRADRAEVELETEDIVFSGNIQLYSHKEEAGVYAEYLEWNSEARQLHGRDNERVEIARDDGSVIHGTGFLADMQRKSLQYQSDVKGSFVDRGSEASSAEEEIHEDSPGE
ncbi:MAG: LPS export ABC transporter periplasmic protein LptC [Spirochaeta sp.]